MTGVKCKSSSCVHNLDTQYPDTSLNSSLSVSLMSSWQKETEWSHRWISGDAVSTLRSVAFATLSHCIHTFSDTRTSRRSSLHTLSAVQFHHVTHWKYKKCSQRRLVGWKKGKERIHFFNKALICYSNTEPLHTLTPNNLAKRKTWYCTNRDIIIAMNHVCKSI